MASLLRRPTAARLSLALVALAACARGDDATSDTALARDLSLAGTAATSPVPTAQATFADTSLAAPTPEVRPVRAPSPTPAPVATPVARRVAEGSAIPRIDPAPAAAAPTPTPAIATPAATSTVSGGSGRSVAAGAGLALSLGSAVCSATNRPGDRFVATLTRPLTGESGAEVLPVGTNVVLELATATTRPDGQAHLELIIRGISVDGFYRAAVAEVADVDSLLQRTRYEVPGSSDRSKIGKGAMAGAVLGRVLGGRGVKGAVIGAAAGAAVGAAGAVGSQHYQGCLPAGAPIRARITEALRIE